MGRNQYWSVRVYDLCVNYMTGTPEGSTKSGFMEKPGIKPATPGLQGIALIHYTMGGGGRGLLEEDNFSMVPIIIFFHRESSFLKYTDFKKGLGGQKIYLK